MEGGPLDENELVALARAGDGAAYEVLVGQHQELAMRVAFLITGSAAEAEDAAQEAFVKAFYALDRFRADAPFRPWLLRIVANEARNRRRSSGRRAAQELREGEGHASGGAAPSPEAAAVAEDDRRRLLAAVNGLREEDRLVIACRFFLDLNEAEMAEALGCARGTVKSRLSRAVARLRQSMVGGELPAEVTRG